MGLLATTEHREALLKFLSVDIDTLSVFRNNIVLFGPLLSAGIGLFLQAG